MEKTIYVRLLNEGTTVFRPVTALNLGSDVYLISDVDANMFEDEILEFKPGTRVIVQERILEGKKTLMAVASAP